jgi:hypothetical protein
MEIAMILRMSLLACMLSVSGVAHAQPVVELKFEKGKFCRTYANEALGYVAGLREGQYVYVFWGEYAGKDLVNAGEPVMADLTRKSEVGVFGTTGGIYVYKVPATDTYGIVYRQRPGYMPDSFQVTICAYNTMLDNPKAVLPHMDW